MPYLLAANAADEAKAGSRDALFDDDDDALLKSGEKSEKNAYSSDAYSSASGIKGFVQFNVARDYQAPVHWSQMMTRANVSSQGNLGDGIKWKLGARLDFDAVYSVTDFYPSAVAKDQRLNLYLLENYLDIGAGDWDFRLGKQNVVWGEMVGLFFADVVSAREMREFILPGFDLIRIPQWTARAEYFKDDFHAELLWIPVASYNRIGKPGAEFFPFDPPAIPGVATQFQDEVFPSRNLSNTNYGLRLSTLKNGWDISGFAYSSMDIEPTFYRQSVAAPQPTAIYQARHDRINQFGGTLAKDFGSVVLKGEGVYTRGRQFYVSSPGDTDGVVPQNTLDWALGLDFTLPAETRLNVQVFQRAFFNYDPNLISDKQENGYSLLVNHKLSDKLEAQVTWISSLNRTDWLLRPRVAWNFEKNWLLAAGVDVFKGPPLGFFGRFDGKDRVYSEVRYSF
ncbi:DUF1302 family protein [Propionivibrio sp.]|uniref:DUF1302 family protein n=1 Tax=Propionivibrio sp. TaxID=2212460 RepID=UPI003BF2EC10